MTLPNYRASEAYRDDYECQGCGALGGLRGDTELHAHHLTATEDGGSDELQNLITFCEDCHQSRHGSSDGAKTRALLTETEREQIAGEHGRDRRYQATSRARGRIQEELARDIDVLKEHHPELLEELREVVCDDDRNGSPRGRGGSTDGR
jgi:hypothetical protein